VRDRDLETRIVGEVVGVVEPMRGVRVGGHGIEMPMDVVSRELDVSKYVEGIMIQ
jgi:hypothetical protein